MKEGKSGSGVLTIMGIIIVVLLILFANQRNENEQAKEEFARQTARADALKQGSILATQKMENKVEDCIGVLDAVQFVNTEQCVVGVIYEVIESNEKRDAYTAPERTYAFFINQITTRIFYLVSSGDSGVFLNNYVGDCVKVSGKILLDDEGIPAMSIYEHDGTYVNIEKLPDDLCHP